MGWRGECWIEDRAQPGSWNMALDQAMLEYATTASCVVLRIYRWSSPTISLGYFQSYDDFVRQPDSQGLDCVRRVTGGGAIWHDRELTYSMAIPSPLKAKGHSESLYRKVHDAIADWLGGLGTSVHRWETLEANLPPSEALTNVASTVSTPHHESSFWCFDRRTAVDLIRDTRKILGSAQRRTAGVLLQHGSLILESPTDEWKWGLFARETATDIRLGPSSFAQILQGALSEHVTQWSATGPTGEVLRRTEEGVKNQFGNPDWTRFRHKQNQEARTFSH